MIPGKAGDSVLKVNVRFFASLRELLGNIREEEYEVKDGTTLTDLLLQYIPGRHRNISKSWKEWIFETERNEIKFGKDGIPVLTYYLVLVNGRSYNSISEDERRPGLRYKLKDGDEIAILPPVGGG
jgi:MoaD family protein